jgi:hypothetical protein
MGWHMVAFHTLNQKRWLPWHWLPVGVWRPLKPGVMTLQRYAWVYARCEYSVHCSAEQPTKLHTCVHHDIQISACPQKSAQIHLIHIYMGLSHCVTGDGGIGGGCSGGIVLGSVAGCEWTPLRAVQWYRWWQLANTSTVAVNHDSADGLCLSGRALIWNTQATDAPSGEFE